MIKKHKKSSKTKILSHQDINVRSAFTNIDKSLINTPSISLRYFNSNYCTFYKFARVNRLLLKKFDKFIDQVNSINKWADISKGCIPTKMDWSKEQKDKFKITCPLDTKQLDYKHYKLSEEARVFGFILNNTFELVYLDPNHKINKE